MFTQGQGRCRDEEEQAAVVIALVQSDRQGASPMLGLHITDATLKRMRTTVRLDPEVAAAAERMRRERHIGLGEAVNELARAGLARDEQTRPFRQRTANVGITVDVSNVAEALEVLDRYDGGTGS